MNPGARVRFVVETAQAVLDDRLAAETAVRSIALQAEQITPLLRLDRLDVTSAEASDVADRLRTLAERVNDRASGLPDPQTVEAHLRIAETIGAVGQVLR